VTQVLSRPPGYDGTVPFGFGIVELPEGLRIIARLIDCGGARQGLSVELTLEPVGTDEQGRELVSYAFRPANDQPPSTSHQ
jgi:hypothetical protein